MNKNEAPNKMQKGEGQVKAWGKDRQRVNSAAAVVVAAAADDDDRREQQQQATGNRQQAVRKCRGGRAMRSQRMTCLGRGNRLSKNGAKPQGMRGVKHNLHKKPNEQTSISSHRAAREKITRPASQYACRLRVRLRNKNSSDDSRR
ncbi:hypothetical protein I7I51_07403 [Histoplasma capsulatum]|uniref:Uncharacterized protein n=1 Tax=Ajellomyces capsulatus TaxID=5037 RepID=A0A8A1LZZ4_AJECA|nr:hypothetical protein I7I51_07403 [Histoplasma capsulatum]